MEKKIWPEPFEAILSGVKKYELRLADWECSVGDELFLREYDPDKKKYTGREMIKKVTYVGKTKDWQVWPEEDIDKYGFMILSLE